MHLPTCYMSGCGLMHICSWRPLSGVLKTAIYGEFSFILWLNYACVATPSMLLESSWILSLILYLIILSHETARFRHDSVPITLHTFLEGKPCLLMPKVIETWGVVAVHDVQLPTSPVKTCWHSFFMSNTPSVALVMNDPGGEGTYRGEDKILLYDTKQEVQVHLFFCLVS